MIPCLTLVYYPSLGSGYSAVVGSCWDYSAVADCGSGYSAAVDYHRRFVGCVAGYHHLVVFFADHHPGPVVDRHPAALDFLCLAPCSLKIVAAAVSFSYPPFLMYED